MHGYRHYRYLHAAGIAFRADPAGACAGKHVVCEKPLVGSLADIDAPSSPAEKTARGQLMPIFQIPLWRRHPEGQAASSTPASPASLYRRHLRNPLGPSAQNTMRVPWRGKWATELGGVLMTHSIHLHDMLTYLMGPIAGTASAASPPASTILRSRIAPAPSLLEPRPARLPPISATLGSQEQISRLRLCFENVLIESNHEPYSPGQDPWKIVPANDEVGGEDRRTACRLDPVPIRFNTQMKLFHEALVSGGPLPVTTVDARQALELVTAFYESSKPAPRSAFRSARRARNTKSWRPA